MLKFTPPNIVRLCGSRVKGAKKMGNTWLVPADAEKDIIDALRDDMT